MYKYPLQAHFLNLGEQFGRKKPLFSPNEFIGQTECFMLFFNAFFLFYFISAPVYFQYEKELMLL